MKAFKNCRPPRARYSTTWSIDSLLSFWDTQHENSLLTLKLLTLKTVSLVAISSLSRADELANVLLENHSESEKGLSFILSRNHDRGPIPPLFVEMIPGRPNICPVVVIREHMRRTQESREVVNVNVISRTASIRNRVSRRVFHVCLSRVGVLYLFQEAQAH